jgi:hypothetical protein
MNYFGVKELYGVALKCTSNMEINGKWFKEGEPIIFFDKLQIAYLNEQKKRTSAKGGYGNATLVKWEDTTGMGIQLSEGVISKTGLSVLSNSKILSQDNSSISIPYSEDLESTKEEDERYYLYLRYPVDKQKRPYVYRNGERVTNYLWDNTGPNSNGRIIISDVDDEAEIEPPIYTVYYDYKYQGKTERLCIGQRLVRGFLSLTGRMRLKDDQSGKETTCLIEIPKVELMSDLTMRLGSGASPYIYGFNLQAHPVGERGNQYVCKFTMLDEDIDSDI